MARSRTQLGSGANAACVLTVPAITGSKVHVEAVIFSLSATPSPPVLLTIESPSGTTIGQGYITAAGMGPVPLGESCLEGALSSDVVFRLPAVAGATGALTILERCH